MTLTPMPTPFIKSLIPHLPRYAEEEGDFYTVPRTALVDVLCQQSQRDRAVAETVIALLETLLDTLAVLDTDYLQKGEWCWVSFPAQLLALSVLTAWSDSDSRLFASNFWNTQGSSNAKKDQQRDMLRAIETRRVEHHAQQAAQPIRYIYVAWSLIKLDGKILLYQREDTRKRFDSQAGDYGLVGGRLNQHDVTGDWLLPDLLAALQSGDSLPIKTALPVTLQRELHEETGLECGRHYQFKPWRCLRPFRQVQGSAPNHALTDYHFEVFQIELTLEGYLFLQRQVAQDERLVWFSPKDMLPTQSAKDFPYLHALLADFDNDNAEFEQALTTLPDSFVGQYRFQPQKYGLTLPLDYRMPLLAGTLGKEKPLALSLTERQLAILLGLAAHLRGFEFIEVEESVIFHPFGWLKLKPCSSLQSELIGLATALKETDLIIENYGDVFIPLVDNP
ncbi:NUDIX hydrolase [Methylocucumis oryzae]|uniref:NUDIX hydrolase n=1 Tax=Methylocucumis oryzae TaxID=1632867 RepID=A0A0F3IEX5_9GAMM|nr:NUDIX domain-containing protein [Methylocucumis oryzae]KJV05370.1 NUDIX hydrolase [Methylocucumis oryzae]